MTKYQEYKLTVILYLVIIYVSFATPMIIGLTLR